jgi:hypothetical protein
LPDASTTTSASSALGRSRSGGAFFGVGRTVHHVPVDDVAVGDRPDQLADSALLVLDRLGERSVEVAPPFRRHGRHRDLDLVVDQAVDELLERDAVALQERGALALAVVGEHDDVVRTWSFGDGQLQSAQLVVEPAERVEGGRRGDAGVVCDLVVADEVGVGGGDAAVDVADQRVHRDVAQDGRGRRTQQRIHAAAIEAWFDAPASRPAPIRPARGRCRRSRAPAAG